MEGATNDANEPTASDNHDRVDDANIEPPKIVSPDHERASLVESLGNVSQTPPMPHSIGLKPFVSMFLLLSASALSAAGQHFFYSYVNGKNVESFRIPQDWVIRVGTGFAFLFHIILVPAVATAYAHRFWYSATQRALTVRTIDGLFMLAGNPFELFNLELISNAKMLCVFALVGYLIPLASILSPGALTGSSLVQLELTSKLVANTLTTSNITAHVPTVASWNGDVGFVEFGSANSYIGPSNQLMRIATRVLTTGEVLTFPSPCGANCTYNVTLTGPAYRCLEYDPSLPLPNLTIPGYPFDTYDPNSFPYYSVEIVGNQTGDGLWVLYGPNATIHCTLWNATYNSNINFTNNIARISSTVELSSPLNATNITSETSTYALFSGPQNTSGILDEWQAVNSYTVQKAISSLLQGYIYVAGVAGGFVTKDTKIGVANFVDISATNHLTFQGNTSDLLESLLMNTTLSITNFLSRAALPVFFQQNVSQPATYTQVPAFVTTYPAQYVYNRLPLWGSYGLALGLATICSVSGGLMAWRNGMVGDLGFSQVLKTTRNPTLDKLCSRTVMAGVEIAPGDLKHTRLKYGVLPGDEPRMAFGTEDEIISIRTGT